MYVTYCVEKSRWVVVLERQREKQAARDLGFPVEKDVPVDDGRRNVVACDVVAYPLKLMAVICRNAIDILAETRAAEEASNKEKIRRFEHAG